MHIVHLLIAISAAVLFGAFMEGWKRDWLPMLLLLAVIFINGLLCL